VKGEGWREWKTRSRVVGKSYIVSRVEKMNSIYLLELQENK